MRVPVGTKLFFPGQSLLPEAALRTLARRVVLNSTLIKACQRGDRKAIQALLVGFWYFVRMFEVIIDQRGKELLAKRSVLRRVFPDTAAILVSIAAVIKQMKREEGSHALIWQQDAVRGNFGPLERDFVADGVRELVDQAQAAPLWLLFLILAGTEYLAEELSRVLSRESPNFTAQFATGKFRWGNVHLEDHDDLSHRQIDEDVAWALLYAEDPAADRAAIYSKMYAGVEATIHLFGKAADDVHALFELGTPMAVAAE